MHFQRKSKLYIFPKSSRDRCPFNTTIHCLSVYSRLSGFTSGLLAHLSTKCSWWAFVVSQCPSSVVRRPSSVVRRQPLLKKPTPPTPLGQLTWYLVGSIWVTCRSKIAKIVPIGNPRWRPWRPSWISNRNDFRSINLFFASSPEPKGQLTPNLLGSIGVTCRSKMAKIVLIGNPRWPPWQPSWKSIFCLLSWTERPIDFKLARKHRGDL